MATSSIEWTDATWNPTTGCTRASKGCDNCYAVRMSYRLEQIGCAEYTDLTVKNRRGERHFNGRVRCHPERLAVPSTWRNPRIVFVNSMSDLFHPGVPLSFIQDVFAVMNAEQRHTFQVLTKRPERALSFACELKWTPNIWLGTSVEDSSVMQRVRDLREVPAMVRFLSCEPLLGPLPRLALSGIHWVIVGGESGPGARPMETRWVEQIKSRCLTRGVPFFFKQWGGVNKKKTGRMLNGRTWDEMPLVAAG